MTISPIKLNFHAFLQIFSTVCGSPTTLVLVVYGLQSLVAAVMPPYKADADCWLYRKVKVMFSPFSMPQSARNSDLMYSNSEPPPPPNSLLSSLLPPLDLFEPPGSDTPMMTNHQLSPWWWWRCCQGNRHPGQQAPVAAWAMTISENKVPGVFRIEVGDKWGRVLTVVPHHQMGKGLTFTHRPGPDINTAALT